MAQEAYYLYNDYFKDVLDAELTIVNDVGADKEDTNFVKENAQDEQIALRSGSDDKTNIKIRFDINTAAGGTAALKAFFIGNHNFSGGSVKIYSYTANDYATGQVLEATVAVRLLDMYVRISSPNDRRYWEIDLSDNGSVTSADSQFRWGIIKSYTDFTILTELEDKKNLRGYGFSNIVNITPYGIRSAAHKLHAKRERFGLIWRVRTQASLPAELRTLYDLISGSAHPFVYISNITKTPVFYVYAENDELVYSEVYGTAATDFVENVTLDMIEAVRGKV